MNGLHENLPTALETVTSTLRSRIPSPLKSFLRPLYHLVFRAQLRLRCALNDILQRGYNGAHNIPPALLRFRVGESIDSALFVSVGEGCARLIEEQLQAMEYPIRPGMRILDFGCGCGRVVRVLMRRAPSAAFYGVDVDAEAIRWCLDHLAGGHFQANAPNPPLSYPSAYFDIICCISVFTHLDAEMQDAWLRELKRVLRPRGVLIFTVYSAVATTILDGHERNILRESGSLTHHSTKLKGIVPDWYHTTWHSERYIVERVSRWFSDVQFCELPDSAQDIVRCRG